MGTEPTPTENPMTFDQGQQIIELLTGLHQMGYWIFGSLFFLIGMVTMLLFFAGKGDR